MAERRRPAPGNLHEIRALYDDESVTVYQAYSSAIAGAALKAGTFVSPFKRDRMTWVKPSFLWMMYRSGWATKPDQERVLAVKITRDGFAWALGHAALSAFDATVYGSPDEWRVAKDSSPIRIQWDPERDLRLQPLEARTVQIGIGGEAVARYVDDWIVAISDVTQLAHAVKDLVDRGEEPRATELLPRERHLPVNQV